MCLCSHIRNLKLSCRPLKHIGFQFKETSLMHSTWTNVSVETRDLVFLWGHNAGNRNKKNAPGQGNFCHGMSLIAMLLLTCATLRVLREVISLFSKIYVQSYIYSGKRLLCSILIFL
jgi:hypothetical protein